MEITIETDEVAVVSRAGRAAKLWCPHCRAHVPMRTPEDAAALAGVSPRTVYRWVEAGRVHSVEGPLEQLWVCSASLPRGAGSD